MADADNEETKPSATARAKASKLQVLTEHAGNSRLGRELLAYCLFLILYSVATLAPADDPNYEGLAYTMRDLLLEQDHSQFNTNTSFAGPKFSEVASVSDYWGWVRGPFLHAIYMQDWYSGSPWAVGDQGMLAGNNVIVGTVNIRQKRVKRATCTIPPQFLAATQIQDCIADFSPWVEDKDVYGPFFTEPEWAGSFAYNPGWPGFEGNVRIYSKGGYALELPASSCKRGNGTVPCLLVADSIAKDLQMTGWIDYRTRAVITEVFVYNPSLNYFVMVQAILEMPSTGGATPFINVRASKLLRYSSTADLAILGLEISMMLLIVFDVMEKVVFYRTYAQKLSENRWDLYDGVFHILYYILMIFRLNVVTKFDTLKFDPSIRVYYNLADVIYWDDVAQGLAAWLAWMIWFRMFKYLYHLSWARHILDTLYRATFPLLGLCLAGLVLLLAFAHAGMLAFGTQIHDLRTFGVALISCYRFIFSGMKYAEFRAAGSFLGPVFYIAFKVWMVLIYVRFFVAVILDAYRECMQEQRNRWHLSFPPLEALAKDISLWWESNRSRSNKKKKERPQDGEPQTLSGETMPEVQEKLKQEMMGMTELDAKEMYEVLKDRVTSMQTHMDMRISNIEKIFVTTVAPLVETLDVLVRQHTENAALANVRAVKR